MKNKPFLPLFLSITIPLYVVDQLTKWWVVSTFPEPHLGYKVIPCIPGFFNIVRVHNTGIAFGNFNGTAYANLIFGILSLGALVFIGYLWKKQLFPGLLGRLAIMLLLAGIFGNVTDRIVHGYVVDFLDFYYRDYHWYTFNVADSCICIAAFLLLLLNFKKPEERKN